MQLFRPIVSEIVLQRSTRDASHAGPCRYGEGKQTHIATKSGEGPVKHSTLLNKGCTVRVALSDTCKSRHRRRPMERQEMSDRCPLRCAARARNRKDELTKPDKKCRNSILLHSHQHDSFEAFLTTPPEGRKRWFIPLSIDEKKAAFPFLGATREVCTEP